ncbi:MAG: tyrosine--tRNA ligase [Deltaproteobacteria bacterium]|nr:tyrosine--tRNA ligase [Deltaproteobacteria bacterium]
MIDPREQFERLTRGTATVIPREELQAKLALGRPLRVKLGVDPTAPDIHLGHTVGLTKLRQFQDLGHHAVLIIGDFTAMVGDPSGRSATRPQLTREAVAAAAQTYQEQVFKVLDRARTEVRWNGEWFGKMQFPDVIRLAGQSTVARMLERDDFAKRYREQAPIGVHEFLYPLMQAHDSVEIRADVELGGTDQTFNILLGRQLQKDAGQSPQVALILPLLEGTDGVQKMSKSLGNYVGVAEPAQEIFGKVMSISDHLMQRWYELLIPEPSEAQRALLAAQDWMGAKKALGRALAARFHGEAAGAAAQHAFESRFQQRQLDVDALDEIAAPLKDGKLWLPGALAQAQLVKSNSEARRLLKQRAVRIDGKTVESEEYACVAGALLTVEVGKRRAVRVRVS